MAKGEVADLSALLPLARNFCALYFSDAESPLRWLRLTNEKLFRRSKLFFSR
jgi:hypothetical protein